MYVLILIFISSHENCTFSFMFLKLSEQLQSLEFIKEEDRTSFSQIYIPIIRYAIDHQIPLIPLAIRPSELKVVRTQGFEGLSESDRARDIPDPEGFVQTVSKPAFQRYAKEVLPSFLVYLMKLIT